MVEDNSRHRLRKRTFLKALGIGAIGATGTAAANNTQKHSCPEEVPTPHITERIEGQPQTASLPDLSEYGYTQEEFFISGCARPLGPANPYPIDEREELPEDAENYKTRILVYRPTDPEQFNGGVIAGWPNVTTGRDVPVMWANMYDHVMKEGFVFVVVSAQKVGVDDSPIGQDLQTANPKRYGELHHPGDEYSYDIYSQAVKALQASTDQPSNPLTDFDISRTLAAGMSQSAQYLRYYVNNIQECTGLFDGFLPVVTSQTPRDRDDIRDDVAPVMWVMSEDEANVERRSDSGLFKLWQVAGASHVNHWWSEYVDVMVARDHEGKDVEWNEEAVGQYGQLTGGMYGVCAPDYSDITVLASYNYFPMRYAYKAALKQLDDWVTHGQEPPSAPRFERENGELQRDRFGNVLGGLRLPPIKVPVAFYDAIPCGLTGRTYQLGNATLQELYPTHEAYVEKMQAATNTAIEQGYLLPADGEDLMSRAKDSPISVEP